MDELSEVIDDIARGLSDGTAYLVTGAGFSFGAKGRQGAPLPSAWRLTELLYGTYGSGSPPAEAALGDVFDIAVMRDREAVEGVLRNALTVATDEDTPAGVTTFLALPWARIYTFNIDDMVEVAAGQSGLELEAVSALRSVPSRGVSYVHVNGDVNDGASATFSERQYAERLARRDPWLATMGAELLPSTVVYVGTTIRELHLWRAIEARRLDRQPTLDPRPRSYLVTPQIDPLRREMLAYSKVELIEMSRDEFAKAVLEPVRSRGSRSWLREKSPHPWWSTVEPAGSEDDADSAYLFGTQATWSDVQYVAAPRLFEDALSDDRLSDFTLITGTPGVGKTTTAMKIALARRAAGHEVRYIDVEDVDSYGDVLGEIRRSNDEFDLFLDNAELLGRWLPGIANAFLDAGHGKLVIIAPRRRIGGLRLDDIRVPHATVEVPSLEPEDAAALIEVLRRYDMLGEMDGMPPPAQIERLRRASGQQLLVAMIWATQGEDHRARVIHEYREIEGPARAVYGLISLARHHRYRLKQSEVVLALGKDALVPLQELEAVGTVVRHDGLIQPRHARIAEIVYSAMRAGGELLDAWVSLVQGLSVEQDIDDRHNRVNRAITRLISHDEVRQALGIDNGRLFYGEVREYMRTDYHYWLQRGNFEADTRDGLTACRRFLTTSRAVADGDPLVEVAWGDMLFAEAAAADPAYKVAKAEEAFAHLSDLFPGFGAKNGYPYGVAAKGCLRLVESGDLEQSERMRWLRRAQDEVLVEGIRRHPDDRELTAFRRRLERDFARFAGAR